MTNLAIDIGNSRTKTGFFKDGVLLDVRSYENPAAAAQKDPAAQEELAPLKGLAPEKEFAALKSLVEKYRPENSIVSSVIDPEPELLAWLQEHTRLHHFPGSLRLPIENKYRTPETLGPDRLAAVIGTVPAESTTGNRPRLVIIAGTCVTCNFVTAANEFLGGAISPGLHMRLEAMHTFTGKLPLITLDDSYSGFLGQDTRESMLAGVQAGAAAEAEHMIRSYDEQYPGLQVFLCGGDAEFFDKRLKNSIFADRIVLDRELILKGLDRVLKFQYK